MAYIYNADIYCNDCGDLISLRLLHEGLAPDDPDDEYSYDSDEYPKHVDGTSESDSPDHCGSHANCINAIELSDGSKIGDWLKNSLTTDGEDYTREAVREGGEVSELWVEYYDYLNFA